MSIPNWDEDFGQGESEPIKESEEIRKERFRQAMLNSMWSTSKRVSSHSLQSLPEGYHGRWEMLSLEDFRFLYQIGISID
jgi:hypothetical protein